MHCFTVYLVAASILMYIFVVMIYTTLQKHKPQLCLSVLAEISQCFQEKVEFVCGVPIR